MSRLELSFLGEPIVRHGEEAISLGTRKVLALLAYLAIEPGPHSREKLVALLWPDSKEEQGRTTLRKTLARLVGALDEEHLLTGRDLLAVKHSNLYLDVHTLGAAHKLAKGMGNISLETLQAATQLYRGELLEGLGLNDAPDFEEWLVFQREQVRGQTGFLLGRLSELASERGMQQVALEVATRQCELDPLNEEACQTLMRLEWQAGNPQAALEVYRSLWTGLRHHVHSEPAPETHALAERIQAELVGGKPHRGMPSPKDQVARLLEGPLVGRSEQHEQLTRVYFGAGRGQTQVAVVEGEAGIGKTRLIEAFLGWARAHGATVLRGKAQETGGSLAFQSAVEAIRQFLDREPDPRKLLSDTWLSELSRLLPELAERCPGLAPPLPDATGSRNRLFDAFSRLVQAIAQRHPLVWFVDDLQWSDPTMRELLYYGLGRWKAEDTRVMLVMAVRSEAMRSDPDLVVWVSSLEREVPITRFALQGLKPQDVAQLVHSVAEEDTASSDGFAGWLYKETKGQPLFIAETLKSLFEQGILSSGQNGWQVKPDTLHNRPQDVAPGVRAVIESRLSRLSPKAFELLVAGAVVAQDFDYPLLCRVAGLEEQPSLSAFDELTKGQLLLETSSGYAFSHDKVREVAYEAAGKARRKVLHGKALSVLQTTGTSAAVLVHHALVLGLPEPILRYSIQAGLEAFNLIAYQDAITHLERARDMLETSDLSHSFTADEQLSVYESLRQTNYALGRFEETVATCEGIVALGQRLGEARIEHLGLSQLVSHTTNVWSTHGKPDLDKTEAILRQETEVAVRSGNQALQLLTEYDWTFYEYHRGRYPSALERVERLVQALRQTEGFPPTLLIRSLNLTGLIRQGGGDLAGAFEPTREAISLCGPRDLSRISIGLASLGEAQIKLGYPRQGLEDINRAIEVSQRLRWFAGEASARACKAGGLIELGELMEAHRMALQARDMAVKLGTSPVFNSIGWGGLLLAQQALGQLEAAAKTVLEGLAFDDILARSPYFLSAACGVSVLRGEWELALQSAKTAYSGDAWLEFGHYERSGGLPRWAETLALLKGGEIELARAGVERLGRERVVENKRLRICYLRSRSVLEEWEGNREQALSSLQEALALAEELDLPNERWQLGGEVARLMGDGDDAVEVRKRALEVVSALADKIPDEAMRKGFLEFCHRLIQGGVLA